ncbi:dTDP-4-dehydrorhamnose 3,5-epimerase family protein [Verrucomicrobia bacterium]|nr:dTDP-4-dehydrorhamnose 3,5-epimerase family protein [Verrucomicrobiota bacterium]
MSSENNVIINDVEFFSDQRGEITHSNNSSLEKISRFYFIEHKSTEVVRAWQGHPVEKKMFVAVTGEFLLAWVKIDNFSNPSLNLQAEYIKLSPEKNKCVSIPAGYANGLKAIKKDSKILVFSEFLVNQSMEEKIRFPKHYWFNWGKY